MGLFDGKLLGTHPHEPDHPLTQAVAAALRKRFKKATVAQMGPVTEAHGVFAGELEISHPKMPGAGGILRVGGVPVSGHGSAETYGAFKIDAKTTSNMLSEAREAAEAWATAQGKADREEVVLGKYASKRATAARHGWAEPEKPAEVVAIESQAETFEAPVAEIEARLVVTYSPEGGVVLEGTQRSDAPGIKRVDAARFRWSRREGFWYVAKSRGGRHRTEGEMERVRAQLEERIGEPVRLDYQRSERSAEEVLATREESAERTQEGREARADRATREADAAYSAERAAHKALPPWGEPVKLGHHSAPRHLRDIDRAHKTMGKRLETAKRAERAERIADRGGSDGSTLDAGLARRRIDRRDAEIRGLKRRMGRQVKSHAGDGIDYQRDTQEIIESLELENEADRLAMERQGDKLWSPADFNVGDRVKYDEFVTTVQRVNPKSVTFKPDPAHVRSDFIALNIWKVPYSYMGDRASIEFIERAPPKAPKKKKEPAKKRTPPQVDAIALIGPFVIGGTAYVCVGGSAVLVRTTTGEEPWVVFKRGTYWTVERFRSKKDADAACGTHWQSLTPTELVERLTKTGQLAQLAEAALSFLNPESAPQVPPKRGYLTPAEVRRAIEKGVAAVRMGADLKITRTDFSGTDSEWSIAMPGGQALDAAYYGHQNGIFYAQQAYEEVRGEEWTIKVKTEAELAAAVQRVIEASKAWLGIRERSLADEQEIEEMEREGAAHREAKASKAEAARVKRETKEIAKAAKAEAARVKREAKEIAKGSDPTRALVTFHPSSMGARTELLERLAKLPGKVTVYRLNGNLTVEVDVAQVETVEAWPGLAKIQLGKAWVGSAGGEPVADQLADVTGDRNSGPFPFPFTREDWGKRTTPEFLASIPARADLPPDQLGDYDRAHRSELKHGVDRVFLVSCGSKKLDAPADARELYIGQGFTDQLRWAEFRQNLDKSKEVIAVGVLSAKYGLVLASAELEPYNLRLDELTKAARTQWARSVAAALIGWTHPGSVIVTTAPADYRREWPELLRAQGREVIEPLDGLDQFQRRSALTQARDRKLTAEQLEDLGEEIKAAKRAKQYSTIAEPMAPESAAAARHIAGPVPGQWRTFEDWEAWAKQASLDGAGLPANRHAEHRAMLRATDRIEIDFPDVGATRVPIRTVRAGAEPVVSTRPPRLNMLRRDYAELLHAETGLPVFSNTGRPLWPLPERKKKRPTFKISQDRGMGYGQQWYGDRIRSINSAREIATGIARAHGVPAHIEQERGEGRGPVESIEPPDLAKLSDAEIDKLRGEVQAGVDKLAGREGEEFADMRRGVVAWLAKIDAARPSTVQAPRKRMARDKRRQIRFQIRAALLTDQERGKRGLPANHQGEHADRGLLRAIYQIWGLSDEQEILDLLAKQRKALPYKRETPAEPAQVVAPESDFDKPLGEADRVPPIEAPAEPRVGTVLADWTPSKKGNNRYWEREQFKIRDTGKAGKARYQLFERDPDPGKFERVTWHEVGEKSSQTSVLALANRIAKQAAKKALAAEKKAAKKALAAEKKAAKKKPPAKKKKAAKKKPPPRVTELQARGRAREKFVDPVTGETIPSGTPGAVATGDYIARARSAKGKPLRTVAIAESELGEATYKIDLPQAELNQRAKARSETIEESQAMEKSLAELKGKQALPGVRGTFRTAGQAAAEFMAANEFYYTPLTESGDVGLAVKEWGDQQVVWVPRKGRGKIGVSDLEAGDFRRLGKTTKGAKILDPRGVGDSALILRALTWVFSQARSKRYSDVEWGAIDSLNDSLTVNAMEVNVADQDRGGQETVIYPAASGHYDSRELLAHPEVQRSPRALAKATADFNEAELLELTNGLADAYEAARACLPPAVRRTILRRLRYLKELLAHPTRISGDSICAHARATISAEILAAIEEGGADFSEYDPVCVYPLIVEDTQRLIKTCTDGYDLDWPAKEAQRWEQSPEKFETQLEAVPPAVLHRAATQVQMFPTIPPPESAPVYTFDPDSEAYPEPEDPEHSAELARLTRLAAGRPDAPPITFDQAEADFDQAEADMFESVDEEIPF